MPGTLRKSRAFVYRGRIVGLGCIGIHGSLAVSPRGQLAKDVSQIRHRDLSVGHAGREFEVRLTGSWRKRTSHHARAPYVAGSLSSTQPALRRHSAMNLAPEAALSTSVPETAIADR